MGTSASYSGSGGTPSLLPSWDEGDFQPEQPTSGGDDAPETSEDSESETSSGEQQNQSPTEDEGVERFWRAAKSGMSRYSGSGGAGGGGGLGGVGANYVGSKGGARKAAASAGTGRQTTKRLGAFFSSVANEGIASTAARYGFPDSLGKDVFEVLADICNVIAPNGAFLDDAAARKACDEVLKTLYEKYALEDGIENLDSMDEAGVCEAVALSVEAYIYERWLQELGGCIERAEISDGLAVSLEKKVKNFVTAEVALELGEIDVLNFDWSGTAANKLINGIYQTAYACIEAAE